MYLTLGEWLTFATVLFVVAAILVGAKIWYALRLRISWYMVGFFAFIWLLSLGALAHSYHHHNIRQLGVVIVAETDVRSGPGVDYTLQFTGHDGLIMNIGRQESGWYLVTFENGVKGWITAGAVEII